MWQCYSNSFKTITHFFVLLLWKGKKCVISSIYVICEYVCVVSPLSFYKMHNKQYIYHKWTMNEWIHDIKHVLGMSDKATNSDMQMIPDFHSWKMCCKKRSNLKGLSQGMIPIIEYENEMINWNHELKRQLI